MRKGQLFIHQSKRTWPENVKEKFDKEEINFNWNGTKIMFICQNPSQGKAPGFAVNFKRLLDKYGFSGAFVTNLIDLVDEIPGRDYWKTIHSKILKRKFNLVNPDLIVCVGRVSEKILNNPKSRIDIPIESVCHFSQNSRKILENDIKRVSWIYENIRS